MKILCIGNSFSEDATTYLSDAAAAQGIEICAENLYIGGCSLEQHYNNMISGEAAYDLEINGENTHAKISIQEALTREKWDVVTVQQASHLSAFYSTYQPYMKELVKFIREKCPDTKVYIHQTWGYEDGSQRLKENGFSTRKEMFSKIKESYELAVKECEADGLIPCGQVFENMSKKGITCHRDTFHAAYGVGRYALALTWIKALTDSDINNNSFKGMTEFVNVNESAIIKEAVNKAFA